ncbi:DNRLRE domain-containing protein [Acholeplasma manati]|uniref:DNRLRE domain-containing protein n=1 Tax=Paracholeplasma manati TaxID=591373 RepID=A0ABT2Y721_9MOLU|nr:RHS repeat-associated core domain-containing protein [Paracholeplasma manati]MCV2231780.1 DNRLRE domain-containing protein [Paracholeplasma manati]
MRLRRKLSEKQILMVYKFYKTTQRFFVILALTGILFSLFPNQKFYAAQEIETKPETVEKDYYQSSDVDISLVPIVEEDVSKRTANEKHFRKLDGTYEVALYDNEVHYYENGTWHDIDNRFIDDGNKLENKQNAFKTFFPKHLSDNKSIQIKTKDYSIDWRVIDIDKSSAEYVTNNQKQNVKNELNSIDQSVFYSNIRPNVDLEYILQGSDVKEYIILNDFIDNFSISFEYSLKNLKLVKLSDGIFFVDLNGKKVFEFEDLFMFDSNNEVSNDVDIEIIETKKNTYLVTVLPNLDWLSSAVYPVKIDPTLNSVSTYFSIADTYVSELYPQMNYYQSPDMYLSSTNQNQKYKGLIKFWIPYSIMDKVITYTHLSFSLKDNSYTNGSQIDIYKNTENFNDYSATWDNAPQFELNPIDYHLINNGQPLLFDVTEAVKEWQAQGIQSTHGFTIFQHNGYGSLNVAHQINVPYSTKKPVIKMGYEEPSGLKDYWTYTSQNVGMAGVGYISDYTGKLTFIRNEYSLKNELMPLSLSFYHSQTQTSTNIGYGNGWKTNYSMEVKYDSTFYLYYLINPDGNKIYFMNETCVSVNSAMLECTSTAENGSGYKLVRQSTNGQLDGYVIKTQVDIEYHFDITGRLTKVHNPKKLLSIWVNYIDTSSLKIDYIKDNADNKIEFVYQNNQLYQTTLKLKYDGVNYNDVEKRFYSYSPNNNLTSISYSYNYNSTTQTAWTNDSSDCLYYGYDTSNRLVSAYNDKDDFRIDYAYNTGNKVSGYDVTDSGVLFETNNIEYQNFRTIYTNQSGKQVIYTFDYYGHTVNIIDSFGNTAYYKYSGLFSAINAEPNYNNNHRLIESSDILNQKQNLIVNHGFEENFGWTFLNAVPSYSTDEKLLGSQSIAIVALTSSNYASQEIFLTAGEYTIQGWIKHNGTGTGASIEIVNGTIIANQRPIKSSNTWKKFEITFSVPYSRMVNIKLKNETLSSVAYFDNVQLVSGLTDTRYNPIFNSSFETGINGWNTSTGTSSQSLTETGIYKDVLGNFSLRFDGVPGLNRVAEQNISMFVNAGQLFMIGGWGKADTSPNKTYINNGATVTDGRFFGLVVEFTLANTTQEFLYLPFDSNIEGWQYQMMTFTVPEDVSSVKIKASFNGTGMALFDNIQLFTDDLSTQYAYDTNTGKILEVVHPNGALTNYVYNANGDLISVSKNNKVVELDRNSMGQISQISTNNVRMTYDYDLITQQPISMKMGYDPSSTTQDKWFKTSTSYTSNGQYIATVTDEFGNVNSTTVDESIGLTTEIIDELGRIQKFEYDSYGNLVGTSIEFGSTTLLSGAYIYDTLGRLWKIQRNNYVYEFIYNSLNQVTGVKIADLSLMTYEYWVDEDGIYHSDLLTKQTYGNSDFIEFSYTEEFQIKTVKFNGTIRFEYTYDTFGNLAIYKDIHNGNIYFYSYDLSGRLESIIDQSGNEIIYSYNEAGNLDTYYYNVSNISRAVSYNYNQTTGQYDYTRYVVGNTTIQKEFNYSTDSLKRLNNIELVINNVTLKKIFVYDDSKVNSAMGNATNRIYEVRYQKNNDTVITYRYTYDNAQNITKIEIIQSGTIQEQYNYYYDHLNQLIREDIKIVGQLSKTLVYSYDSQNNITSIKTFGYQTISGTPLSEKKMYYQNTWKDQLTRVEYYTNGTLSYYETMTYDNSGNIIFIQDSRTYYNDKTFQWDGRQLTNYGSYCNSLTFKYNDQGIRTQKIQSSCGGNITTNYVLDGDKVLVETRSNGITIYYTYDVDGSLLSMNYNGTEYFYITNLQGDVIELRDMSGNVVVKYKYDAWGNIVYQSPGTLADINPYRYRGYRFDVETGYYYLQSRYYNPQIGRFISADGQVNEGILGENMYAYTENNPVMNIDPEGTKVWHFVVGFCLIFIGAIISINSTTGNSVMDIGVYFVREGHYDRNYLNTDLPVNAEAAFNEGWIEQKDADFHQSSGPGNKKWLSTDGNREIIVDIAGNIVDDPRDIGTYNFIPNGVNKAGHGFVDVLPWILWGNNSKDSSTIFDRFYLWLKNL